jgi:peroxiredoxin
MPHAIGTKVLTLLALAGAMALTLRAGDVPRPAAPLKVTALDGKTVSLEQYRGKVVAVMFFLTTCGHCQRTTQVLGPIYDEWKSRGLEILGLAIDRNKPGSSDPPPIQKLASFAGKYNVKYPLGLSSTAAVKRFAQMSVVERFYVPFMFFVDRNGKVRAEHPGGDRAFYHNQATNIRTILDTLLKEPAT